MLLFGVDLGGTAGAVVLFICVGLTIAPHLSRLRRAVLLDATPVRPRPVVLVALAPIVVGVHMVGGELQQSDRRSQLMTSGP